MSIYQYCSSSAANRTRAASSDTLCQGLWTAELCAGPVWLSQCVGLSFEAQLNCHLHNCSTFCWLSCSWSFMYACQLQKFLACVAEHWEQCATSIVHVVFWNESAASHCILHQASNSNPMILWSYKMLIQSCIVKLQTSVNFYTLKFSCYNQVQEAMEVFSALQTVSRYCSVGRTLWPLSCHLTVCSSYLQCSICLANSSPSPSVSSHVPAVSPYRAYPASADKIRMTLALTKSPCNLQAFM